MNRQKGFVLPVVVAVFTFLIGVLLLIKYLQKPQALPDEGTSHATQSPTPTPEPLSTADWKTYTNTSLKYSIKYPTTWRVEKTDIVEGVSTVWLKSNSENIPAPSKYNLEIVIGSSSAYSTSGAVCANQWCEQEKPIDVNILGKNYAASITRASTGTNKVFDRYILNIESDNQIPSIIATYFTSRERDEISQILSTFRFLK